MVSLATVNVLKIVIFVLSYLTVLVYTKTIILFTSLSVASGEDLCIGQIEASTCPPPPPPGIHRAFDTFAVPGRREFDHQSLPGGGESDPHALGVGNLNSTLDFM